MAITDEQINKFKEWYESKSTNYDCPVCGRNDWQPKNFQAARMLQGRDPELRGVLFPLLPVVCNNCAYVRFFAARLIEGLFD